MNGKKDVLDGDAAEDELSQSTPPPTPVKTTTDRLQKFYKAILLTPGPIVSLSVLISKGKFRKLCVDNETGGNAAKKLMEHISQQGLGQLMHYRVANNTTVCILLNALRNIMKSFYQQILQHNSTRRRKNADGI